MAESILISLSSKILSSIASPVFKKAYEEGLSIWEARDDLVKLQLTIGTLQSVIIDAERKQEDSDAVKNWIMRLKGVLYDAEDLFDEVAADDLVEEFMVEGCLEKQVWVFCSKLNPVVSRYSIAKRVKSIRERLDDISTIMAQLNFVQNQQPMLINRGERNTTRCSIDPKSIIGRDEEKKAILYMLTNESSNIARSDAPVVISIEGIGGMGKTTLATLIYNDEKIKYIFEKRWFVSISDASDDKEVLKKIYQSIDHESNKNDFNVIQLEEKIRKSVMDMKYLLILDDVWDPHHGNWKNRKRVLSSGAKGSKIIVTTRDSGVGIALGAVRAYTLKGLSEDDSWYLFKSLSFVPGSENDPRRESLGREMLKKCRGLPLAIWCIGNLLHNKTIEEWEEIEKVGLPRLRGEYNEVMGVLKLSYDHLPSNLKQCFTYCSLFPKDYKYDKKKLIYHWVVQSYITLDEGEYSFMHLLRMGFFQQFQEEKIERFDDIKTYKMHDMMHELALHLIGEESIIQTSTSLNVSNVARHMSLMVDSEEGEIWDIPTSLLDAKSIRSCMLRSLSYPRNMPSLHKLLANFKLLRTLTLSGLGMKHIIPPSIGELKLLRYLDLSGNAFIEISDSMTNLVNLLVLDVSGCEILVAWPHNFKKLVKLSYLKFYSGHVESMPEGTGWMLNLQYLSAFKVVKGSELDVLNRLLKQLRDDLCVTFSRGMEVEGELNWQLPVDVSLQHLEIYSYPCQRIRGWENNNCASKLEHLELGYCGKIKFLPHLSCLPILKILKLTNLWNLEYIEEEEEVNTYDKATSNNLYFPCLKELRLSELYKLEGWRRKKAPEATSSSISSAFAFSESICLTKLDIWKCPNLKSFPHFPELQEFQLRYKRGFFDFMKYELSSTNLFSYTYPSLRRLDIIRCWNLKKLHLASPHLQRIRIERCSELISIELIGPHEPSLRNLSIEDCEQLKSLQIEEHLITGLEVMNIWNCPELRLSKTQGKRLLVQQGLPEGEGCELQLKNVDGVLVEQSMSSLSLSSIQTIAIENCTVGLQSLHIPSPYLQSVTLWSCSGLKSVEVEAPTHINIKGCRELKNIHIAHPNALKDLSISFPCQAVKGVHWDIIHNLAECSCISSLDLSGGDGVLIERLLSSPSSSKNLQEGEMSIFKSTGSLTVALVSLEKFTISSVPGLKILNINSRNLRELTIKYCFELTRVRMVNPTALKSLRLTDCPELGLITGAVWGAFTNHRSLEICPLPPTEEVPQRLLDREAPGNLQISQPSSGELSIFKRDGSLILELAYLEELFIDHVRGLRNLNIKSQNLKKLNFLRCSDLGNVRIDNPIALTRLGFEDCPELMKGVDWDALTNLCHLGMRPFFQLKHQLPQCLLKRQALGHLEINKVSPLSLFSFQLEYYSSSIFNQLNLLLPTFPNSSPLNQHPSGRKVLR